MQNADYLLILGCRLNIRQVSYAWQHFARDAYKVIVDIDAAELCKPTMSADLPVHADAAAVTERAAAIGPTMAAERRARRWLAWCAERKARYPVVLAEYWTSKGQVNPYCFVQALFESWPKTRRRHRRRHRLHHHFSGGKAQAGQRLFSDSGCAPMGFDLPAAIGACVAQDRRRVVCLAGDGSIMLNVQELQTIAGLGLPIKIFVLNNQRLSLDPSDPAELLPGQSGGRGAGERGHLPQLRAPGLWVRDSVLPVRLARRTARMRSRRRSRGTDRRCARSCWTRSSRSVHGYHPSGWRTGGWSPRRWRICSPSCRGRSSWATC